MYPKDSSSGGSGGYTVDADAISGHGTDLSTVANDITRQMNAINRKLSTLQGQWKGSAANQYATLHHDWQRQQKAVADSLAKISRALGGAATIYRTTESDVRRAFTPV
ncbi:WXG100 family type VII secretion target [Luteipulveratus sp. YIM 133132]|uniref:ESAT-6-like protein n=1 Tax=Luteipulveratus flavus TaxID=3031728 RepID=A0ABT6C1J6_9MICO|nr:MULTISPECIES: WXG100 family type VII secretion target [unclassified Luteipulveratus]MDE9367263.1 WXG100 family type VII secretion target [Luteipulveratus sp. YIM 133132]MDF8262726.1 WXG100 family type VII secretion target [Luteipulveratus sp. YIM 133296]